MTPAELAELLDSGPALLGGTRSDDLVPEAFRVWGAQLRHDGTLRLLGNADSVATVENLDANGHLAVTVTDIRTFRSLQLKGVAQGRVEAPGPADAALFRRYTERFSAMLDLVGLPPEVGRRLRPDAAFAVVMRIDEMYDQTPGAVAGAPVEMSDR